MKVDAGAVLCVVCVFSVGREMCHSLRTGLTCTTGNTARCCSVAFSADRYTHKHLSHISKCFILVELFITVQSVLM